jgi:hypothetical protein
MKVLPYNRLVSKDRRRQLFFQMLLLNNNYSNNKITRHTKTSKYARSWEQSKTVDTLPERYKDLRIAANKFETTVLNMLKEQK